MTASSKRDLREVFSRRYRRARCSRAKGLPLDEFCAPAMNSFNRRSRSSRKNVLGHGCYGATIGRKPRSIASSPRRRSIEQSRLRSAPSAQLDPFVLSQRIDEKIDGILALVGKQPATKIVAHGFSAGSTKPHPTNVALTP